MLDVVGIGTPDLDILETPKGTFQKPGGSAVNTMSLLSKLGLRTGIIGRVGDDREGREILEELKARGMDVSRVRVDRSNPTTRCYIRSSGNRVEIERIEHHIWEPLSDGDLKLLLNAHSVFIRARNPVFGQCVEFCRKNSKKLFVTLHKGLHETDEKAEKVLEMVGNVSAFFASSTEAEGIRDRLRELSRNVPVIVTEGEKGCTAYVKGKEEKYPGYRAEAVDATGAGDAFAAGYIYGELKGWGMEKRCRFANAMGALAVTAIGARGRIPSLEEALSLAGI